MKKLVVILTCFTLFACAIPKESHLNLKGQLTPDNLVTDNSTKIQEKSKVGAINNKEQDDYALEKDVIVSPKEIEAIEYSKEKSIEAKVKEQTATSPQKEKLPYNLVFEIKETNYTKLYFKYYSNVRRKVFEKWLNRANLYLPYILKVFREHNLPDDLAFLPFAESGFNPFAHSRAGAAGLWQFMPYTAKKYGLTVNWWIDERLDPYKSTVAAAKYLKDLYNIFGDWYLALAAYNAGEGKIIQAIKKADSKNFFKISNHRYLKKETKMYVPKFMAILKIIKQLNTLGFKDFDIDPKKIPTRLFVREGTDLTLLAKHLGMSWYKFRKLNPHFRRYVTPPNIISQIYVPKNFEAKAKEILKMKKVRPYGGLIKYTVRKGDSWWRISRKYKVPISILKSLNRTKSNLLKPGSAILVPKTKATYLAKNNLKRSKILNEKKIKYNYIVKQGDSLWLIARKFNVPLNTILVANNLKKRSIIRPGMKLYIPKSEPKEIKHAQKALKKILYEVKRGDNLWNIARKFGVTTAQLYSWNNLNKNAKIYPGDKLKIFVEN